MESSEHSSHVAINLWPPRVPKTGRRWNGLLFLGTELRPLIYFTLFVKQQLMILFHGPPGWDSGKVVWMESWESTFRSSASTLVSWLWFIHPLSGSKGLGNQGNIYYGLKDLKIIQVLKDLKDCAWTSVYFSSSYTPDNPINIPFVSITIKY